MVPSFGFMRPLDLGDTAVKPFPEPTALGSFHAYKIKKTAVPLALAASRNSFENIALQLTPTGAIMAFHFRPNTLILRRFSRTSS